MNIGKKVVCIDDTDYNFPFAAKKLPVKGEVYTIRGENRVGGIHLEEIKSLTHKEYGEKYPWAKKFDSSKEIYFHPKRFARYEEKKESKTQKVVVPAEA